MCNFFKTSVGVRQGCRPSSVVSNLFLQKIMQEASKTTKNLHRRKTDEPSSQFYMKSE
ncbi:hypothetical protein DPMN_114589 [Dreissena polymorpha]|uniref:Uncharacterized protein n=1 Tax=Dreissena polymorpha TaxID=45954 RepID=A0A9D4KK64_DREPO|nr:hypothetical protein DPMN_114589 [Dreissena polymorpha]